MAFIVADRVWDTATTTGTGAVTVSGAAPSGYQTFSAVCATNDTFPYALRNQAANEFEVGIGTYNGSNVFTRTKVLSSSNSNALVNFSAGTKDVILTVPARNAYSREVIQDNRTYYVRTDGNDSNDGLADNSGGAFLTIGKAMTVCSQIDFNGYSVTVQVRAGTYAESVAIPRTVGQGNWYNFTIQGDTTTPSNVVISNSAAYTGCIELQADVNCSVRGFKLVSSNNGYGIAGHGGACHFGYMDFGNCQQAHVLNEGSGLIESYEPYNITGNATFHFASISAGALIKVLGQTVTISGGLTINTFANTQDGGGITSFGTTWTANPTGLRYQSTNNGVIQTYGSGTSYFPGTSAGSTSTGGIYS